MSNDRKDSAESTLGKDTRRTFLNWLWAALAGMACLEAGWLGISSLRSPQKKRELQKPETIIAAGNLEQFLPNTVTAISEGQFYLACLEDGSLLALSKTCTHLGCSIPWDEQLQKFICPCHGSTFNLKGEVLSAPAPRPLDVFPVRIENGIVKVNISHPKKRDHFAPEQATRLS